MPRKEEPRRPEHADPLTREFGALLVYFLTKSYGAIHLSQLGIEHEDDLKQAAWLCLLERRAELDAATSKQERGAVALRAFGRGAARYANANRWHGYRSENLDKELVNFIDFEDGSSTLDYIEQEDTGFADVEMADLLSRLPERARVMIEQRMDGYTWAEVGDMHGITGATAGQYVTRKLSDLGMTANNQVITDVEEATAERKRQFEAQTRYGPDLATHCGKGHSLEDAYYEQRGDGRIRRTCRTCKLARERATTKRLAPSA